MTCINTSTQCGVVSVPPIIKRDCMGDLYAEIRLRYMNKVEHIGISPKAHSGYEVMPPEFFKSSLLNAVIRNQVLLDTREGDPTAKALDELARFEMSVLGTTSISTTPNYSTKFLKQLEEAQAEGIALLDQNGMPLRDEKENDKSKANGSSGEIDSEAYKAYAEADVLSKVIDTSAYTRSRREGGALGGCANISKTIVDAARAEAIARAEILASAAEDGSAFDPDRAIAEAVDDILAPRPKVSYTFGNSCLKLNPKLAEALSVYENKKRMLSFKDMNQHVSHLLDSFGHDYMDSVDLDVNDKHLSESAIRFYATTEELFEMRRVITSMMPCQILAVCTLRDADPLKREPPESPFCDAVVKVTIKLFIESHPEKEAVRLSQMQNPKDVVPVPVAKALIASGKKRRKGLKPSMKNEGDAQSQDAAATDPLDAAAATKRAEQIIRELSKLPAYDSPYAQISQANQEPKVSTSHSNDTKTPTAPAPANASAGAANTAAVADANASAVAANNVAVPDANASAGAANTAAVADANASAVAANNVAVPDATTAVAADGVAVSTVDGACMAVADANAAVDTHREVAVDDAPNVAVLDTNAAVAADGVADASVDGACVAVAQANTASEDSEVVVAAVGDTHRLAVTDANTAVAPAAVMPCGDDVDLGCEVSSDVGSVAKGSIRASSTSSHAVDSASTTSDAKAFSSADTLEKTVATALVDNSTSPSYFHAMDDKQQASIPQTVVAQHNENAASVAVVASAMPIASVSVAEHINPMNRETIATVASSSFIPITQNQSVHTANAVDSSVSISAQTPCSADVDTSDMASTQAMGSLHPTSDIAMAAVDYGKDEGCTPIGAVDAVRHHGCAAKHVDSVQRPSGLHEVLAVTDKDTKSCSGPYEATQKAPMTKASRASERPPASMQKASVATERPPASMQKASVATERTSVATQKAPVVMDKHSVAKAPAPEIKLSLCQGIEEVIKQMGASLYCRPEMVVLKDGSKVESARSRRRAVAAAAAVAAVEKAATATTSASQSASAKSRDNTLQVSAAHDAGACSTVDGGQAMMAASHDDGVVALADGTVVSSIRPSANVAAATTAGISAAAQSDMLAVAGGYKTSAAPRDNESRDSNTVVDAHGVAGANESPVEKTAAQTKYMDRAVAAQGSGNALTISGAAGAVSGGRLHMSEDLKRAFRYMVDDMTREPPVAEGITQKTIASIVDSEAICRENAIAFDEYGNATRISEVGESALAQRLKDIGIEPKPLQSRVIGIIQEQIARQKEEAERVRRGFVRQVEAMI